MWRPWPKPSSTVSGAPPDGSSGQADSLVGEAGRARVRISKVKAERIYPPPQVTQASPSFYGWENSGSERERGAHHELLPDYLLYPAASQGLGPGQ